jgi:predicted ATPase
MHWQVGKGKVGRRGTEGRQADRQTGRQADREAGIQTGRQRKVSNIAGGEQIIPPSCRVIFTRSVERSQHEDSALACAGARIRSA